MSLIITSTCEFAITEHDDERVYVIGCELGRNTCENCGIRTKALEEWDYPGYAEGPVCSKCPKCGGLAVDGTCATPGCSEPYTGDIPF